MATDQTLPSAHVPVDSLETVVNYGGRLVDIQRFIGLNDYWLRSVCNPVDRSLIWFRRGFSETEIVLESLHDELLDVVQAVLDVAVESTDEDERRIQSLFDRARQQIRERAKQLRSSNE